MRMNRLAYDFIRGKPRDPKTALYLRQNLPAESDPPLRFPDGSITIKAAWREFRLPQERALLDRYHCVDALLVNPQTRKCEKKTMGLVGLHIVHKTPSRPQWVWSTFEHVDNALDVDGPARTGLTFSDPTGPRQGADVNALPPPVNAANPPQADPKPVQVVRLKPIDESTQKTNQLYQGHPQVKGTLWKNYQLVATQWPTQPTAGGDGTPFPPNRVANVTMETRFQSISCMSCHKETQKRTDFVWMLAVRAHGAPEHGAAPAVKTLQEHAGK
jgi:hypothetical protein